MPKQISNILAHIDKHPLRKARQPDWIEPMLATLTEDYFSDKDWLYEPKLDGVRCLVFKACDRVKLMSRNEKMLNSIYPELVTPFESLPFDFIADGEIVAFKEGITSFSTLQNRINIRQPSGRLIEQVPVFIYLFDLLHFDGYDLTKLPLKTRKEVLQEAVDYKDPLRFSEHRETEGEEFFQEACENGWEGLIAKDANSTYVFGRSRSWLKFKCTQQQEFVIGGYTPPKGSREGFGAILIGYYDDGRLKYAGKVGTGFKNKQLKEIESLLLAKEIEASPFDSSIREKNIHWTAPEAVAEIGFTEWTTAKRLRHPRFLGLRHDKLPREVIRETTNNGSS